MARIREMTETKTAYQSPYGGFDKLYIGGQWREGGTGRSHGDLDPWSGENLQEIAGGNPGDVDQAYRVAKDAQVDWAATTPGTRAGVLRRAGELMTSRKDEIVDWLVHESGSTVGKAEFEWNLTRTVMYEAASMPHHMAGQILPSDVPGKENRVYRRPVGVVGTISPWNVPLCLSNRTVGPALALGNGVVLKPAEDTPVTGGLLLAKIFEEAGLPPGLLNVVTHSQDDSAAAGDAMTEHPIPRAISFTGSTKVGLGITQKAGVKKLGLELGGNAPVVILDDADLDQAVDGAVYSSYFHQGQTCMIANRVIVDAAVHDEFVGAFVDRLRGLVTGDPSDPKTFIGPVINHRQLAGIQNKVQRARDNGATLLLGGDPGGPSGLSLPPHVLTGTNDVATAREEVFGPVITIISAKDEAHALELANDTEYGLSSAVYTCDAERGVRFALQIEAGMSHVNDVSVEDEPHIAFGGEKQSGIGRFGGTWAIDEFTTPHWVSVQHEPRRLEM
jgi:aldehyde dehydrogenase (NAD+)